MAFHFPSSPTRLLVGATTLLAVLISLFAPSCTAALDCATQKLPANRTYANCTNLPTLGATLHFTYNATNRSLAVAFAASPPKADGWVAWGINPTGTGMVGTQALVALKQNGTVAVSRFNLTSYRKIDPVKALSLDTWDLSAEEASGVITIFAAVKLPEKADSVNHVWQVGPTQEGRLSIHGNSDENLKAKAALQVSGSGASASNGTNTTTTGAGSGSGGKSGALTVGFGWVPLLLLLFISVLALM